MIFAMTQKLTFDKNGIKRNEVAFEFLPLISFHYLRCRVKLFWGKNEARGLSLKDELDIFSTRNTADILSMTDLTSITFGYFRALKSRIRPVYSNTKRHTRFNHIPNALVNTARVRSSEKCS